MSQFFNSALRSFGYLLSLPERTLRSLAAVAGGTTSLLTDTLFPEALRSTTLYKVFVGDTQRFVISKIAQVQRESEQAGAAQTDDPSYMPRKLLGGAFETAGLFAMHVSPLWVFAIAGDAAAGTNVFLQRLVDQLKKNDVIPPDTQVTQLGDLLAVIHDTSRKGAAAVDTPPLSREELNQLASDMISSSREVFSKATDLLPRMETIWATMQQVADRQNISMDALSGILSIDVTGYARKGVGAVMALGQTGQALFSEKILDNYAATLDRVSSQGVTQFVSQHMTPFLTRACSHFDPEQRSWIESFIGLSRNTE